MEWLDPDAEDLLENGVMRCKGCGAEFTGIKGWDLAMREGVNVDIDYLRQIRESRLIDEAVESAIQYNEQFDLNDMDTANDLYAEFSNPDDRQRINNISTVVWQVICGLIEHEELKHLDQAKLFHAIFAQVEIAHWG